MLKAILNIDSEIDCRLNMYIGETCEIINLKDGDSLSKQVSLKGNRLSITVNNEYYKEEKEKSVLKNMISVILLPIFLFMLPPIYKLNYPAVRKKHIIFEANDDSVINLHIKSREIDDLYFPEYVFECENCEIISESSGTTVDNAELNREYSERKKAIVILILTFSIVFCCFIALSFVFHNHVTTMFLLIIAVIIVSSLFYAFYKLKQRVVFLKNNYEIFKTKSKERL